EYAGVEQLVLELFPRAPAVCFYKIAVGILALGVLVEVLHVGVCRCAVEIKIVLFDILSVVRLAVGEPEQALFQNRITFVPQRYGKAQSLLVIANTAKPILTPFVGSGPRLVVAEV